MQIIKCKKCLIFLELQKLIEKSCLFLVQMQIKYPGMHA